MKERVLLIKPSTYVNNSGLAVVQAMRIFSFEICDLVVVVDDFNLPEGLVRLREKGSDGGHNGLKSIIYSLDSLEFARLRIGIGEADSKKDRDFVLGCFSSEKVLKNIVQKGAESVRIISELGVKRAMNLVNKSVAEKNKQEEQF